VKSVAVFVSFVILLSFFVSANSSQSGSSEIGIKAENKINEREKNILDFKDRIKDNGKIRIENRNVTIREISDERKEIIAGKINARTGLNLTIEDIENMTALRAYLSNGRHAYIKIMPDKASLVALERLGAKCAERNCTVELKEVGEGNKTRLAYVVETEKESRVFLLFKNKMIVRAEIDAETGEIIKIKKPWWAFLAREKYEKVTEDELGTE